MEGKRNRRLDQLISILIREVIPYYAQKQLRQKHGFEGLNLEMAERRDVLERARKIPKEAIQVSRTRLAFATMHPLLITVEPFALYFSLSHHHLDSSLCNLRPRRRVTTSLIFQATPAPARTSPPSASANISPPYSTTSRSPTRFFHLLQWTSFDLVGPQP